MFRSGLSRVSSVRLNSTLTPHKNASTILPKLSDVQAEDLYNKSSFGGLTRTYFIPRTSKGNLPIYKTIKSQAVYTEIRKIEGSVTQCRNDLQAFLSETNKKDYHCNPTTGSIFIKGDYSSRLKNALAETF